MSTVIKGDRLRAGIDVGIVMDVDNSGHALLIFMPKISGPSRPPEWVSIARCEVIEDAVPTRQVQISE